MTQKYIVSVPGRAHPLCIEADSFDRDGWNDAGFTFRRGADVVAQLPVADLVAKADSLPVFPDLSQFKGPDLVLPESVCLASLSEPVRALDPLPAQSFANLHSPSGLAFWPFLSGCLLGLIGGAGLALSHAGLW